MKHLNIVVEGNSEELFINDVLKPHLVQFNIFVSARRITTGWDRLNRKPAKGGLLYYSWFKNDILNWIASDRGNTNCWYTSMLDLYAFPKGGESPYNEQIQSIQNPFTKINALQNAIEQDINHVRFISYVQLHEFETFLMVDPSRLISLYPDKQVAINRLKRDIGATIPELINDSPETAPSKRIIKFIPEYEAQKAQVGPLVAEDIGLIHLREKCEHFNQWVSKLEVL